jgi:hypothetical protein
LLFKIFLAIEVVSSFIFKFLILKYLSPIWVRISAILYPIELDPAQRPWYYDGDGQKVCKETGLVFKEPFSS